MPLFVCDDCGCVENTALGLYWGKGITEFKDELKNDKALCSVCVPKEFSDGSVNNKAGYGMGNSKEKSGTEKMKF